MKKIQLPLLSALMCFFQMQSNAQLIKNLFFNSYDNIVKLNFTSGSPVVQYTGISNGFEAIAHAEDGNGNVIFYVNSNGVYNKNNQFMLNSSGLYADPSSAEIDICPNPSNPNKYYVIYNAQTCSELYYAEVDMSLNGGLGDVTVKNRLIDNNSYSEGLEVVRIPGANAFWLLAFDCTNKKIMRFKIDATGISAPQVVVNVNNSPGSMFGYDGRNELEFHKGKIGLTFNNSDEAFLADFNPTTGAGTNAKLFILSPNATVTAGSYGMEFSPSGRYAYFSLWYEVNKHNLFRYDYSTNKIDSFFLQPPGVTVSGFGGPGQIELGPDGKLYIIHDYCKAITVLNTPDMLNPTISTIMTNSELALGISDHIQSDIFSSSNMTYENVCIGDTTHFYAISNFDHDSLSFFWDFGDPASGLNNHSINDSAIHIYNQPGNYSIVLLITNKNITDTVRNKITISDHHFTKIGNDSTFCSNGCIPIGVSIGQGSFTWNTGASDSIISACATGLYTLKYANGCLSDSIQFNIKKFDVSPNENIDTIICNGGTAFANLTDKGTSVLWNDGSTALVRTLNQAGQYKATINNVCGSFNISYNVYIANDSILQNINDTVLLCVGDTITLTSKFPYNNYWSTGASTPSIKVSQTEHIIIYQAMPCGTYSDVIEVKTIPCECTKLAIPTAFTPNGDNKNDIFKPIVQCQNISNYYFAVYNRWGERVFTTTNLNEGWDGQYKNTPQESDSYEWMMTFTSEMNGKYIPVKKSGSVTLLY